MLIRMILRAQGEMRGMRSAIAIARLYRLVTLIDIRDIFRYRMTGISQLCLLHLDIVQPYLITLIA
jgi:hypothetical protein